ncbi:hypothetical protein [Pseudomonas marginalis]|uniref:hypothetical protein n=1 Tax=Pseudomonas marginalis TaxID=298 RepID=UPI0011B3817C|nr:hypothetical protein [Pseudomonas marginalis]TWR71866.1 hypothetical protein FIV40_09175 [Pseudomonas marginalis]
MPYAINKQGGCRCVDGPDDLESGEVFSKTLPSTPDSVLTKAEVEMLRLYAYSDPITGSDRFIAEAASMRLHGSEEAALSAEERHRVRRGEIETQYPWPI